MKKTIIIWICMMVLLLSSVFATIDINVSLNPYYTFDDTDVSGGYIINVVEPGKWNATANGAGLVRTTGISGQTWNVSNTVGQCDQGRVNMDFGATEIDTVEFTMSVWYRPNLATDTNTRQFGGASRSDNRILYQVNSYTSFAMPVEAQNTGIYTASGNPQLKRNEWKHFVLRREANGNTSIWVNGSFLGGATKDSGKVDLQDDFVLYCAVINGVNDNGIDGSLDEFGYWNRSLNASEIDYLWNNGTGNFFPFGAGAPPAANDTSSIDLLFSNVTHPDTYVTSLDEGEDFIVWINWTNQTSGDALNATFGNCSISIEGGLYENESSDQDFTLCSVGCDYSEYEDVFWLDDNSTGQGVVEDAARFDACHIQGVTNDLLSGFECVAGGINFTVDKNDIPRCNIGNASIVVNTSFCNASSSVNFTLFNPGVQGFMVSELELTREFVNHTEHPGDVVFNSTLELWRTGGNHEFYKHGSKNIYANCSGVNEEVNNATKEVLTVVDAPPVIFLSGVVLPNGSTVTLINDVVVEFVNGTYEFLVEVVDDDLLRWNVSLWNASGIFTSWNGTGTVENLTVDSSSFVDFVDNPWNLSVFANDTAGNTSFSSVNFTLGDSFVPSCNFTNIIMNLNFNNSFNFQCTDQNVFSINVTCDNGFSFNTTGLNVLEYDFSETIFVNSTQIQCDYIVFDGHTNEKLEKDWKVNKKNVLQQNDTLEFMVNLLEVGDIRLVDGKLDFKAEKDRYKFKATYDLIKPYQTVYYYFGNDSVYHFPSSEYPGWIVNDDKKLWLDFKAGVPVTTIMHPNYFEFRIDTNESEMWFESIGELNNISGSFNISGQYNVLSGWVTFGTCPSTESSVDLMKILVGISAFFVVLGLISLGIFGVFGGLGFIVLSWYIVACQSVFGWLLAGAGGFMLIYFFLIKENRRF